MAGELAGDHKGSIQCAKRHSDFSYRTSLEKRKWRKPGLRPLVRRHFLVNSRALARLDIGEHFSEKYDYM